jgi:hypothetical protein
VFDDAAPGGDRTDAADRFSREGNAPDAGQVRGGDRLRKREPGGNYSAPPLRIRGEALRSQTSELRLNLGKRSFAIELDVDDDAP